MIKSDRCLWLTPLPNTKSQSVSKGAAEVGAHTTLLKVPSPYKIPYQSEVGDSRHGRRTH